jgi:hypothetical protein
LASELSLRTGTRIVAVRNFGPIKQGTPGIVTGTVQSVSVWFSRLTYSCTFAGNVRVLAKPRQIEVLDHGYSLVELENPQFGLHELLRMRLRRMRTG